MAEEFQAGERSGNWWTSTSSSSGFDPATTAAASAINSIGCFGWTEEMGESKARSCDESLASGFGSSIGYQDTQNVQVSDSMAGRRGFMVDSRLLPMANFSLSSPTLEWNHALLHSGRVESSSSHPMIQGDELGTSRAYLQQQETAILESNQLQTLIGNSSINPFKDMNQAFLLHQHHLINSGNVSGDCSLTGSSFPVVSSGSYGCPSTMFQSLFEQDFKPDQYASSDNRSGNYLSPMANRLNVTEFSQANWPKFPHFLKVSSPKQHPNQIPIPNVNSLRLNSSAASVSFPRSGVYPDTQFLTQKLEEKPISSNTIVKSISEGSRRDSNLATKKSGNEQAFKKPRNETPSPPLPTFKVQVRKEKLGDRITALQQLVSPFGKTDTASVLHESIEYIKFLHEQVGVLTTPYFKNGAPIQHHQVQNSDKSKVREGPKQDLRSRSLCLVPISNIYPVADEPTADFWTPAFGGTFR